MYYQIPWDMGAAFNGFMGTGLCGCTNTGI